MTRREDLLERLEETVFALMMEEVISVEGRKALEENERLKADKSFVVPEETYRKGLSTIKKHFSRNTRQATVRTMSKLISRVAVIVLVLLLLFTTAFATIPELRTKTLNLIMEVFDDRTRITLSEYAPEKEDNENEKLLGGWVPVGFDLVDESADGPVCWRKYSDGGGGRLEFFLFRSETFSYEVDTEQAEVTEIVIGGHKGMQVIKGKRIHIIFFDYDKGLIYDTLGENIPLESVICAAESRIVLK